MDDFRKIVRGVPNHVVARLLSTVTPGVDFTGCSKTSMAVDWERANDISKSILSHKIDKDRFVQLVVAWRKDQEEAAAEARACALNVEPGDEVAVFRGNTLCFLTKVDMVTADDITLVGVVDGAPNRVDGPYSLDGRMLRRKYASDKYVRIECATDQHRVGFYRTGLIKRIRLAPWDKLSTAELEATLGRLGLK